ncbi:MAG: ATP-binding protein [Candidatus Aquicultor sp.]|nr:ATP-binding protein [Candidatus Aquicultor sp.]
MNRLRIFISSAQKEFAEERRELKAYLYGDPLLRRFFEVFLFEDLPASDRRADSVYLDEVDCCDIYVGLFGQDYGYEDAEGISPTEREFDRATAAGKHPSHAAVLLFGKLPQRFLVTSEVKCLHFHGTEVRKPIPSYQIYKGTVFELVDQSLDFVMSKIARSVGTRERGPQAPVEYELPREAVGEAIVNAIAHRDYTSNASVQVMLFADRLEVWNPGQLPSTLTLESLRVPHASIPHNPLLAGPLFLAGYIEKAGTGILDMIARCAEAELPTPDFRQDGGQFVQTLWRPVPQEVTREVTEQVGTKSAPSRNPRKVPRRDCVSGPYGNSPTIRQNQVPAPSSQSID